MRPAALPTPAALLANPFVLPSYRILSRHLTPMLNTCSGFPGWQIASECDERILQSAIGCPLGESAIALDRPFLIGFVVYKAPRYPEHQHCQNHNDDEQDPGLRRCQPYAIALEGIEEQIQHIKHGGVGRSAKRGATCDHICRREDLERSDHAGDKREQNDRRYHWDRDIEELL